MNEYSNNVFVCLFVVLFNDVSVHIYLISEFEVYIVRPEYHDLKFEQK